MLREKSAIKVACCAGFWCTNIGNAFFELGVIHVLENMLGKRNVTIVSDLQTYANGIGWRNYPIKNQLQYLSKLDVDYLVLMGPVISKYFLQLWESVLTELAHKGIGYILLSAGMMKMTDKSHADCKAFFEKNPPFALVSRDLETYMTFGQYALHAYNGICFSYFAPDYYAPCSLVTDSPYWTLNFDKIPEPYIQAGRGKANNRAFNYKDEWYSVQTGGGIGAVSKKTDRFTDALIYVSSLFPQPKRPNQIGKYNVIRTDHRFYPHFRSKIYSRPRSFCADIPYGYLNLYANTDCTFSDRVHACAVTLAFGHSAMFFAATSRDGLLSRIGVKDIHSRPVCADMAYLNEEKRKMTDWLDNIIKADK